jgi:hypothetical protein
VRDNLDMRPTMPLPREDYRQHLDHADGSETGTYPDSV